MRELAKSLETKEAEIALVDQEIQQLETDVQDGTDGIADSLNKMFSIYTVCCG